MSLQLRNLFNLHRLMEEHVEGATGGTGGDVDLSVDVDAASDAIGADLGLNDGEGTSELLDGSATPPDKVKSEPSPQEKAAAEAREKAAAAAKGKTPAAQQAKLAEAKKILTDKKVDFTGKADVDVLKLAEETAKAGLPQPKAMPKAWKAEHKAIWDKVPPEAQAYIEQREAQIEEGFKAQGEAGHYAKAVKDIFGQYDALLTSQGAPNHGVVLKTLLNSHFTLSTGTPEVKADFIAKLCKNYGVDVSAAAAAYAKDPTPQLTATERELKARLDAMEAGQAKNQNATFEALKADSEREVAAFAADPKHIYFNDVAGEVALLLRDPNLKLADAYERAVYANPVTRAKELARLNKEAEEKARAEAEEKAKAAEKARGTRIKGKEEERASPDLLGSIDDTLRDTFRTIQGRQS